MSVSEILKNIREKNNLTQDQMAERVGVTRQAVSRWETGETQPNTEMLKAMSRAALKKRLERSYPSSFSPVVTHQSIEAPPFVGMSKLLGMCACTAMKRSGRRMASRWAYCAAPEWPVMR